MIWRIVELYCNYSLPLEDPELKPFMLSNIRVDIRQYRNAY